MCIGELSCLCTGERCVGIGEVSCFCTEVCVVCA